ncbi:Rhodanese-like protein [Hypoxylon fragiforme]|uniref:Rhodanese-like protein n=1 Tax=Hypoxylon fragiforme TaxID=63214 RepID=UPI0020C67F36|nr:Rhodanese-like protein [Hypoxylon fragiforme]KAI2607327.1 Rhodanese-like protein [Hypoxylon fragiforme]
MATRRLALSAPLRGSTSTTVRVAAAAVAPRAAALSTASASASRGPATVLLLRQQRNILAAPRHTTSGTGSRAGQQLRWSSGSAVGGSGSGNRIWSFEEINAAISPPSDSDSDSDPSPPKVLLIDTREPSELAQTGRIPGAVNIPIVSAPDSLHLPADEFLDRYGFEQPAKTNAEERNDGRNDSRRDDDGLPQLVFYCKAGVRSRAAAQIAREAGFVNVGEYPGSWLDWVERGGKVER